MSNYEEQMKSLRQEEEEMKARHRREDRRAHDLRDQHSQVSQIIEDNPPITKMDEVKMFAKLLLWGFGIMGAIYGIYMLFTL